MHRSALTLLAAVVAVVMVGGAVSSRFVARSVPDQSPRTRHALAYHQVWQATLDANADSTAVVDHKAPIGHNKKGLVVFVLTGNNTSDCDPGNPLKHATTYAFNARTGHLLWRRSTSGPSRCTTAAPGVSAHYVYSPGLDGRIHKYSVGTGREYRKNGWPKRFTRMPGVEKESANLVASHHYLYATTSGFIGDAGHYEGHLVTVNLTSGHRNVFNSLCSGIHKLLAPKPRSRTYCGSVQSGMFGRGQAAIDPLNRDVYVSTGNGPWNGRSNWGDSVLKLDPSGRRLLDAFTPRNQAYLNNTDQDLGSTGPAVLPAVSVNGRRYNLLVQGGKGAATASDRPRVLWLVNRDRMGSKPGPGHPGRGMQHIDAPGGCEVLTAPAVWRSARGQVYVFYANDCGLTAYKVKVHGVKRPRLVVAWGVQGSFTTPVVSSNHVYVAGGGQVRSYGAAKGHLLWSSGSIGSLHWEYPSLAGGMLFMTDEDGKLYAFRRSK